MKVEGWMMDDEGWMMKDLSYMWGFASGLMDEQIDFCECKVTFATENFPLPTYINSITRFSFIFQLN